MADTRTINVESTSTVQIMTSQKQYHIKVNLTGNLSDYITNYSEQLWLIGGKAIEDNRIKENVEIKNNALIGFIYTQGEKNFTNPFSYPIHSLTSNECECTQGQAEKLHIALQEFEKMRTDFVSQLQPKFNQLASTQSTLFQDRRDAKRAFLFKLINVLNHKDDLTYICELKFNKAQPYLLIPVSINDIIFQIKEDPKLNCNIDDIEAGFFHNGVKNLIKMIKEKENNFVSKFETLVQVNTNLTQKPTQTAGNNKKF